MKRKIIVAVLCFVMMITAVPFTAFAADSCNCEYTPVVYIKGRTNIYKTTDDVSDGNLAETNVSGGTDSILEAAGNIVPALGIALLTDEWDDYCDILYEEIVPMYDQYKLNNDGEIDNKSGINPYWSLESMSARVREGGRDGHIRNRNWIMYTQFQYDMRLDPCVNAETLHQYIEVVKEVSGHDKVCIVSRCEGTVIANAYFNIYGYESVEKTIVYNSISSGAEIADDIYSNKAELDSAAVNRFVNQFLDSSPILDLIKQTVNLAAFNGLLSDGTDAVNKIYDKVSAKLMPRLIRDIFGTCPGWWGMVSPEVYEECKEFVLEGNPDGKYDKLIEKIDNYNYNYKVNNKKILEQMQADGVCVYILAKYGSQMYPVIESHDILGDGVVSLYKQTFNGATTAEVGEVLSDSYVDRQVEAGLEKYISADRMVDGSTAGFRDYTWYFKELDHHVYPDSIDPMMLQLLRYDGYATVDTFEEMPQFMLFRSVKNDEGKEIGVPEPLTEDNKDYSKDTADTSSMFTVLFKFITALINFMTSLLSTK